MKTKKLYNIRTITIEMSYIIYSINPNDDCEKMDILKTTETQCNAIKSIKEIVRKSADIRLFNPINANNLKNLQNGKFFVKDNDMKITVYEKSEEIKEIKSDDSLSNQFIYTINVRVLLHYIIADISQMQTMISPEKNKLIRYNDNNSNHFCHADQCCYNLSKKMNKLCDLHQNNFKMDNKLYAVRITNNFLKKLEDCNGRLDKIKMTKCLYNFFALNTEFISQHANFEKTIIGKLREFNNIFSISEKNIFNTQKYINYFVNKNDSNIIEINMEEFGRSFKKILDN